MGTMSLGSLMFLAFLVIAVGAVWGIANLVRKVSGYGPFLVLGIGGLMLLFIIAGKPPVR